MNELVESTSKIVQAFLLEGDGATNSILNDLDADPSFQNVEEKITTLASINNDTRWAMGEILMFIRYRAIFTPVAVFEWEGAEWPTALYEFVKNRYKQTLSGQPSEVVEFLAWQSYRYEKFWLLVGKGSIKVWEKTHGKELGEDEFEAYVRRLAAGITEILDANTLLSYYTAAFCFPRSKRHPDVAWTAQYEITNRAGNQVDDSLRGVERLEAKAPIAQKMLEDMRSTGRVTVGRVREEQRKDTQKKAGYVWQMPPVEYLNVIDAETGEVFRALDFMGVSEAATAILFHIGLGRGYPANGVELCWNGNRVELTDGTLVATCPNPDEHVVASALAALAGKMRWRIKR